MAILVCTGNAGKLREFQASLRQWGQVLGLRDLPNALGTAYEEPCEDGQSFVQNGLKKLSAAAQAFAHRPDLDHIDYVLIDDSGLCVPSLDFLPGVHSAIYSGTPRDDARNRRRLASQVSSHESAKRGPCHDQRLDGFFVCSLLCLDFAKFRREPKLQELIFGWARQADHHLDFPSKAWEEAQFQNVMREQRDSLKPVFSNNALVREGLQLVYGFVWGEVSGTEQQLLEGEGHGYDAIFFPNKSPLKSFASIPLQEKNSLSHRGNAVGMLASQLGEGPKSSELVSDG